MSISESLTGFDVYEFVTTERTDVLRTAIDFAITAIDSTHIVDPEAANAHFPRRFLHLAETATAADTDLDIHDARPVSNPDYQFFADEPKQVETLTFGEAEVSKEPLDSPDDSREAMARKLVDSAAATTANEVVIDESGAHLSTTFQIPTTSYPDAVTKTYKEVDQVSQVDIDELGNFRQTV